MKDAVVQSIFEEFWFWNRVWRSGCETPMGCATF